MKSRMQIAFVDCYTGGEWPGIEIQEEIGHGV